MEQSIYILDIKAMALKGDTIGKSHRPITAINAPSGNYYIFSHGQLCSHFKIEMNGEIQCFFYAVKIFNFIL